MADAAERAPYSSTSAAQTSLLDESFSTIASR